MSRSTGKVRVKRTGLVWGTGKRKGAVNRASKLESIMRASLTLIIAFVLLITSAPSVYSQMFSSPLEYPVGDSPRAIATADLNGDTYLDLVVANRGDLSAVGTDSISILFNNGDGTFAAAVAYDVGKQPSGVSAADFDGDGNPDLAVSNWASDDVAILENDGNGNFSLDASYIAGAIGAAPRAIVAVDLSGEGDIDIAVANEWADSVGVLKNVGDGSFYGVVKYAVGLVPWSIAAADFDKNSTIDLVTANSESDSISMLPGNGDATFGDSVNYRTGDSPRGVTAADFNGDGWIDLATANFATHNVSVLVNNQDGTFAAPVNYFASSNPRGLCATLLDGDASIDIAVANYTSNDVTILMNNGDGTFAVHLDLAVGLNPTAICAGDFNKDGANDLAVTNLGSNSVSILFNGGDFNTGVADGGDVEVLPGEVALRQNYPNPFNPATSIEFALASREHVSLAIYNVAGQKIRQLADRDYAAGTHVLSWDGRDEYGQAVATGVYFYRLQAGNVVESKKMVFLK